MNLYFSVKNALTDFQDFWVGLYLNEETNKYEVVVHEPTEAQEDNDLYEYTDIIKAVHKYNERAKHLQRRWFGAV